MRPPPSSVEINHSEATAVVEAVETVKGLSILDSSKIFVAGGVAGVVSAVLTYPFDMVKSTFQSA